MRLMKRPKDLEKWRTALTALSLCDPTPHFVDFQFDRRKSPLLAFIADAQGGDCSPREADAIFDLARRLGLIKQGADGSWAGTQQPVVLS